MSPMATFMVLLVSYGANNHQFLYDRKLCAWMFCLTSAAFHESNRIRWGQNDMMVWQTLIFLEQTMALWRAHIPIVMKAWNSTDCECCSDRCMCSAAFDAIGAVSDPWTPVLAARLYGITIRHWPMSSEWRRREEAREAEWEKDPKTRAKQDLFNKDALHWSKVTVKTFGMFQNILF